MQERFIYKNRMVFTFVIFGFILILVFTSLILIKNKTLLSRVYFETILDDATGLNSKPSIYFKGFEIGRIDHFELNSESNKILVQFYIYENYRDKIVKYAVISQNKNLLLGSSNQYEILLPQQKLMQQLKPLDEGALVPYIESKIGKEYAKKGQITLKSNSIESILTSVNNLLLNLQKENNPEAGAIFSILDKLSKISDSLLAISQQVQNENLVLEIKNTLLGLQSVLKSSSATITKAETTLTNADQLLNSADNVIQSYNNPAAIITEVTQNKIPAVIDDAIINLKYLQAILKEVHLQREQLGLVIVSFNKTLNQLEKTLQGVNNNPLIKEGIQPELKPMSIEVNEN